jgi:hypothetical protein
MRGGIIILCTTMKSYYWRRNKVFEIALGTLSCLAIYGSARHVSAIVPDIIGNRLTYESVSKLHLISESVQCPVIPTIPEDRDVILVLVRSCTKCSAGYLNDARGIEKMFKSKGFETVLVTQDSQAVIDTLQGKSVWPSGNIVSDADHRISLALGSPDLPQVAVFQNNRLIFTGNEKDSLKQSLMKFSLQQNVDPARLEESMEEGVVPCGAK